MSNQRATGSVGAGVTVGFGWTTGCTAEGAEAAAEALSASRFDWAIRLSPFQESNSRANPTGRLFLVRRFMQTSNSEKGSLGLQSRLYKLGGIAPKVIGGFERDDQRWKGNFPIGPGVLAQLGHQEMIGSIGKERERGSSIE